MTTQRIKIPDWADHHALKAWWYVSECVDACGYDVQKDREFVMLIANLARYYYAEFEFFMAVRNGDDV